MNRAATWTRFRDPLNPCCTDTLPVTRDAMIVAITGAGIATSDGRPA
ncbi:hypothetical protein [Methylobacterium terricola]|nr:hypothetical protein [Methylobacterium terricola]